MCPHFPLLPRCVNQHYSKRGLLTRKRTSDHIIIIAAARGPGGGSAPNIRILLALSAGLGLLPLDELGLVCFKRNSQTSAEADKRVSHGTHRHANEGQRLQLLTGHSAAPCSSAFAVLCALLDVTSHPTCRWSRPRLHHPILTLCPPSLGQLAAPGHAT